MSFSGMILESDSGKKELSLAIPLLLKFVIPESRIIFNRMEKLNKEKYNPYSSAPNVF